MVHRKVTVLPAVKLVTPLLFALGVVIVIPGSTPKTLHAPVPVVGLLPANVKLLVLH